MRSRVASFIVGVSLVFAASVVARPSGAVAGERVPGTRIELELPAGMKKQERFPGYSDESTLASILAHQIPSPFEAVAKDMNEPGLKARDLKFLSKQNRKFGKFKGLMVEATQELAQRKVWIALIDLEGETAFITASYPKDARQSTAEAVKGALAKVKIAPKSAVEEGAFDIQPVDGYEFLPNLSGNMIAIGKKSVMRGSPRPVLIGGPSISKGMKLPDPKAFSLDRLNRSGSAREIKPESTEEVTIDGLKGYATTASAKGMRGESVKLYHVMLFDTDAYYMFQGTDPSTDGAEIAHFKKMLQTFKRKKK